MTSDRPTSERWRKATAKLGEIIFFLWMLHFFAFCLFDLLPEAAITQTGIFAADRAMLEATRERLGLHGEWYRRYWQNLQHLLSGELGMTIQGRYPVGVLFKDRLIASIPLLLSTFLVTLLLGSAAAFIFSQRHLTKAQATILGLAHMGMVPQFLAAAILTASWVWFQGTFASDSTLLRQVLATAACAALPSAILFVAAGNTAHQLAKQPFATAYEAIGASSTFIRVKLFRNVAFSLRPLGGRLVLAILTGTVIAEYAFNLKGIGSLLADALKASDFPVVFAWLLFSGAATLISSVLSEVKNDPQNP